MNKHKFFGILNLLDVVIISVVLIMIVPFIHYYLKFNEKGIAEQKMLESFIKQEARSTYGFQVAPHQCVIEINATLKGVKKEDINKIKIGDKETFPDGTVLAEISWIGKVRKNSYFADLGNNKGTMLAESADDGLYSIPIKIKLRGVLREQNDFVYKGKQAKQFNIFKFNSGSYIYDFIIEEWICPQYSGVINLSVSLKDVKKEDIDKIKVGDKEALGDGTVLAEITEVGKPVRNYYVVDIGKTGYPVFRETEDDSLYSIPVKLSLKCIVKWGGTAFYKGIEVRQLYEYIFDSGAYRCYFIIEEGTNASGII